MRRASWKIRSVLVPFAVAALLGACAEPAPETVDGWTRIDLTQREPAVEARPRANVAKPYSADLSTLGAKEVRDLSTLPESSFKLYPHLGGAEVQVLEQAARSRLAWSVELGAEPYLSVRPTLNEKAPCPCELRVGVRVDGEIVELLRRRPAIPREAPVAETIDLAPWAGRTVELLFQVDGPGSRPGAPLPHARWISPAIYSRKALPAPAGSAERPNVLLIGADTLRADHVGAFRDPDTPPWEPSLTPALDRLAAESDVWTRAFSAFNVTNPSFASLHTGLYGKNHGVYDLHTALPASHRTLAEEFQAAGYRTLAVIAARHLGDHNSGLGQGFDEVVLSTDHSAAERIVETVMDWIAGGEGPFFVWLHLFDPHTPHVPPEPFALGLGAAEPRGLAPLGTFRHFRSSGRIPRYESNLLAGHKDLYASEVAYMDRQIDRLLGFLESRDLVERSLIAFTADHGENLDEHGMLHRHIGLWDTTTHVPLMIRWPGAARPGRRTDALVQSFDLYPTLLAGAGLEVPEQDGQDLRELTGDGRRGRRAVFSEHANTFGVTVRTEDFRYMRSVDNPHIPDGAYLFDLNADPGETKNLAGTGHPQEKVLDELLRRWVRDRRERAAAETRDLSPEDEARLRALGYLN